MKIIQIVLAFLSAFFSVLALYLGFTQPAIIATTYFVMAGLSGAVLTLSAKNLDDSLKISIGIISSLFLLVVIASQA